MKKEVLNYNMKDCFKIVPTNTEENEFVIVIGNHLATEERFQSRTQAERRLNKTDWNLISAFFFALKEAAEHEKKIKESNEQITEE
jgi:hypothetical protein